MTRMPSSEITPDQDAIVGEVEVAAPPDRVFLALTDPAQLIRWWGDDFCKTSVWEMDARLGGKWRLEASDPSGKIVVNGVRDFKATERSPSSILRMCWPTPGWGTGTITRAAVHGALGTLGDQERYPGQGHSQRSFRSTDCPQGLRGWLAGIARIASKILRVEGRKRRQLNGYQCSYSR
jgi:uncharacterized protein YndB with AHSA1/START domain